MILSNRDTTATPRSSIVVSFTLKFTVIFAVLVSNPFDFAAILPLALLLDALFTDVGSNSVLLSSLPFADVFAAVSPDECAVALALVVHELARILLAVFPLELALAVHFVLAPVAGVRFAIWPEVVPETADFVVLKSALVIASICEGQSSLTFFLSVFVFAFVPGTIGP